MVNQNTEKNTEKNPEKSAEKNAEKIAEKIAVVGLGYVGLPVALAIARRFPNTVGFDVNTKRIQSLREGIDTNGETEKSEITETPIHFTHDVEDLRACTFFVVAVPTPVDHQKRPDLTPLLKASATVGQVLKKGDVVVFESTVYPGVTEDICGPALSKHSGLPCGDDDNGFVLGYSPERINPGDREHTLERITKVVSGQTPRALERVAHVYGCVVPAGIHQAPCIKVAEAAKVIENTQRDLNIALMNELALIFDRIGIRTADVLAAASTKWNFLPFSPGLVGGHCIGVDPYYLTTKAQELGYHPEVILAGRHINDAMGAFVAQKMVKMLQSRHLSRRLSDAESAPASTSARTLPRVALLGLTFKENVSDLRNSRVPDIVEELRQFGIEPLIHDPLADAHEAHEEYGLTLTPWESLKDLDGVILAVPHRFYRDMPVEKLLGILTQDAQAYTAVVDVRSMLVKQANLVEKLPSRVAYWSL